MAVNGTKETIEPKILLKEEDVAAEPKILLKEQDVAAEPKILLKQEDVAEEPKILLKQEGVAAEPKISITDQAESDPKENPYAYLDRNDFTSEKYKVEVSNLPKHYGFAEFKKLVNKKLKLKSSKVKIPKPNSKFLFVCFRSEEDKNEALAMLHGYSWKNSVLDAKNAKAVPDPLVKKRNEQIDNRSDSKRVKLDNDETEKQMINAVTPLWNVPYPEQLIQKTNYIKKVLLEYGKQLKKTKSSLGLTEWLEKQQAKYDGLPCELLEIQSLKDDLEKCVGYRNKCEFTIGMDVENKEPTVGFRVGAYIHGNTYVAPVDKMSNVPERMKYAVKCFQDLVRTSKIPVFNPETYAGHWRQLTVRLSLKTGQLMLICVVHTENMEESAVESLKKLILSYFTEGAGTECKVNSLYFQKAKKRAPGEGNSFPLELLHGMEYIVEEVNDLKFRISPESFFQVNTAASELLYNSAKDLASINSKTTVFDICCGSGTIGLCIAKECAQVVGVEIQEQAVNMARLNATENGITNVQFFVGKAEEIMNKHEFQKPEGADDIVAIVDPPRAGLHIKAISLLRKMTHLKRLVYLSCNPKAVVQNFLALSMAESKTKQGAPFVPVKAIPVDMFPQTSHCELVMYFERYSENMATVD